MNELIQFPSHQSLLTIRELSQELKISIKTIYYWVGRSDIPFIKIGRHIRFNRDQVLQFFADKTRQGVPCRGIETLVEQDIHGGRTSSRSSLKTRSSNFAET